MMNNELIPTPMMSFGESVKTCFQKYVTFKGRARRSEYWWFWLLNLIVSIVTLVLDYKLDMINIEFGIGALSGLYTLIVFLPSLAYPYAAFTTQDTAVGTTSSPSSPS